MVLLLFTGIFMITIAILKTEPMFQSSKAETSAVQVDTEKKERIPEFPSYEDTLHEHTVTNTESLLVLVNKERLLPPSYVPRDLVVPNVPRSPETSAKNVYMRKEAAQALEQLFTAAQAENLQLLAVSGYRSYEYQQKLYQRNIKTQGEEKTQAYSAPPGASEHQTGLAMDITSKAAQYQLNEAFGNTAEGQWLIKHAHEFGFIIRYNASKQSITGYAYEPWHIRYIGNPYASYLQSNNLTLEEATKQVVAK